MAQKTSALTDELIHSILKFDPATNRQAYKHAKETASRALRGYQYARTNQFDVTTSFAGLDEKFRVKNRDDLADALKTRIQRLEGAASKFTPDVLSLLLQLADRPLENTRVEALDLLRPPTPPPQITWDEILQDDPYSDEDIWKDVDYALDSSGDEHTSKKREKAKPSPPTSIDDDNTYSSEACIVPVQLHLVKDLEAAQFWNTDSQEEDAKTEITELQAVRETLFMLSGIQTSLYKLDKEQNNIHINSRYVLSHAMPGTVEHLLSELVDIGKSVYRLRQWTQRPSTLPLLQTFETAIRIRLTAYDRSLAHLQERYLTPIAPIPVSLLELHSGVRSLSVPLLRLAQIVADIEPHLVANPFSHLEALFEQATLAQMTLELDVFQYLSTVFFECLQTYLKPIRRWMEDGELGSNDQTFFVFETDAGSDAASLWHDRYVLRRDADDQLRSPAFLQPAVKKIFNTGKSVIFLKELGVHNVRLRATEHEPKLDHPIVCGIADQVPLSPFPDLFEAAFDNWMLSKYSQASTVLRQHIFESSGLMRTLVLFETLYLGKNGAVFEAIANTLFERMDAGRKGWNDRYVLTELARAIFGIVMPSSDAERLVVRSSKIKNEGKSVKGLATVSIDFALPWAIQNIIQRLSIPIYQQMFTFLLQAYRAKYLLQRVRPARTPNSKGSHNMLPRKLQHRLTWFADTLRSYLTETVIFFTTRDMYAAMAKAEDIDEMSHIHSTYVAKLQERAMLSKDLKLIHKAIIEILDLGILLAETLANNRHHRNTDASTSKSKVSRRKSAAPVLTAVDLSDSDDGEGNNGESSPKASEATARQSPTEVCQIVDRELARLLPFVTAGLRSVGRAGAEPMWEQLAERLEWAGKKDCV
jgi:gamma-tubulin complex component 5